MTHGLDSLFRDVDDFHRVFGHPRASGPTFQDIDRAAARALWVKSEMDELLEAKTIAEQADAYIDAIYFCIGGLVELGVNPGPLWDIVQAANMSKVWPDGTVHRRAEDNKVIKPPEWRDPGPQLEAEIQRQLDIY